MVQSDPAGEECVRCGHWKRDKRSPDSALPEHKRNQRGDPYPGASGPADEHCYSRLGASSAGKNDPARTFKILTVMSPVAVATSLSRVPLRSSPRCADAVRRR